MLALALNERILNESAAQPEPEIKMIGASGFQQAPKAVDEPSISFKAGQEANRRGEKLHQSALKNLRPGFRQYDDFIAGFDNPKYCVKNSRAGE